MLTDAGLDGDCGIDDVGEQISNNGLAVGPPKVWAGAMLGMAGAGVGDGVSNTLRKSPSINPNEVTNQTRTQLRDLAIRKGLVAKGDATHADYPRKWDDPATGKPRLRLDTGHVDPTTGQPYKNPNAAADHLHANDANGAKILVNGDNHIPIIGE